MEKLATPSASRVMTKQEESNERKSQNVFATFFDPKHLICLHNDILLHNMLLSK